MSFVLALVLFIAGLGLIIYFAEKLVAGVVGSAAGFGLSAFWISVVFIGFDPENLFVGAAGSHEQMAGIALGAIIGAAMVAVGLALGITALIVPLEFKEAPRRILLIPVASVALAWGLMLDGRLSRLDGIILLLGYAAAVIYLFYLNRRGVDIKAGGEVAETLEEENPRGRWRSFGVMILSLAAIIAGSEMVVISSRRIIASLGWTDTLFGMTVLAFLVSVEEIARELPAALKKRPDVTYGNVLGSVLAFFLFNAGIIALVRPVEVSGQTLRFYLPVCALTIVVTSVIMAFRRFPRWGGAVLLVLYGIFVLAGYL
jgi:cation:H+ antiporter